MIPDEELRNQLAPWSLWGWLKGHPRLYLAVQILLVILLAAYNLFMLGFTITYFFVSDPPQVPQTLFQSESWGDRAEPLFWIAIWLLPWLPYLGKVVRKLVGFAFRAFANWTPRQQQRWLWRPANYLMKTSARWMAHLMEQYKDLTDDHQADHFPDARAICCLFLMPADPTRTQPLDAVQYGGEALGDAAILEQRFLDAPGGKLQMQRHFAIGGSLQGKVCLIGMLEQLIDEEILPEIDSPTLRQRLARIRLGMAYEAALDAGVDVELYEIEDEEEEDDSVAV